MRRSSGQRFLAELLFAHVLAMAVLFWQREADAQVVELGSRVNFFHEPAKGSTMTVYPPSTDLTVNPWDFLSVTAGWEADIVSGASERIKSGPLSRTGSADVVSGASVKDVRHLGRGSVAIKRESTQLTLGGSDSVENDYKSASFN